MVVGVVHVNAESLMDKSPDLTPALSITTTVPEKDRWPEEIYVYGSIVAKEAISISAHIGGYPLTEIFVNVGDKVSKGQLLARFDSSLLLAEQAELKARSEQAIVNRERALRLQKQQAISEQDVLQAITDAKIAQALLAKNQLQLEYTQILATEDGIISARFATLGATVPVGQELFQMIKGGILEWRGEVNAVQLPIIRSGQAVVLKLPDATTAQAVVRQIAPALNPQTRLAIVYADLNKNSSARAGMYVSGSIGTGTSPALTVPSRSVIIRDGHNYVLTLDEELELSSVTMQKVAIGRRRGQLVEITNGLSPNSIVVVEGAGFLSDGDIVRVIQSKGAVDLTDGETP